MYYDEPGYTHHHRGNPPISGVKYIYTGWFRYSLRRPIYEDIPRLQYFEQVEGKGTEIGLVLKSEDEWKHVIDTYEYFKVCVDNEEDGLVWGYMHLHK